MKPLTSRELMRIAELAGFDWSEADLEPMRAGLARLHEGLAGLEHLGLDAVAPCSPRPGGEA